MILGYRTWVFGLLHLGWKNSDQPYVPFYQALALLGKLPGLGFDRSTCKPSLKNVSGTLIPKLKKDRKERTTRGCMVTFFLHGDISKRAQLQNQPIGLIWVLQKVRLCVGQPPLEKEFWTATICVGDNPVPIFFVNGKHLTTNWFACNLHHLPNR